MIQGKLGLSIREPEGITPTQVPKVTPRHVARWVTNLPVANVSDSSRRLYQMLLDCNKSSLSDDDRLKILMQLHSIAQNVLKSLSRHFTGHTLSLTDKQKKIAALVQALHTELAIGFKTIIEHEAESPSILGKKLLQTSIFLALEYLSLTVVRCYQIYTTVPARIWQEINTIYRFAVEQKLHEKSCHFEGFQTEHSIQDVFIKISLLSIASPYQLRQQEIEVVFKGLQKYVEHCKLENSSRFDNRYVIDLNESKAPVHQALAKVRPSQNTYSFNLDNVVLQLQMELKQRRQKNQEVAIGGLSLRLIRHLLKSWAHLSSRNFARTPCEGFLHVSIGLSATHQFLSSPEDGNLADSPETLEHLEGSLRHATLLDDEQNLSTLQSFGNSSVAQPTSNDADIWAKLYRPRQAMPVNNEIDYAHSFGKENLSAHINKPAHHLMDAEIVNISPGGYCLHLNGKYPNQTQTGEIIGLLEVEDNGQENWNIGVIRWIKRKAENPGLQIGIQLIAPGAKPIRSQTPNAHSTRKEYQDALLLPELKGIGQPATILTSPSTYTTNQKVKVYDGEEAFEARLTKLVSSSQGFRQFYFEREVVKSSYDQASPGDDPGKRNDDFDTVWDLI
ncbi:hypothetical protein [Pleionea sp. CnH1-48]|uniref:hypothetical protein n=1 Tax=Pleionea sp. CnH1-48 TaxID=2954494 RepID=UPI002096F317|nr:hypothetical protein [Pleionea sp. CnH1-48]MCO7227422.1 hypothetical protein [Pleionea sp. CnH1-48]